MTTSDETYNKLIKTWIDEAESGKAERNYKKFLTEKWNPLMKKLKDVDEKIKLLEERKTKKIFVSQDELKELKKDALKYRKELRAMLADKTELAKRRNYPDEDWIKENIDWA